jgi:formylglycine-generating enzyme required for sulfatase activity
VGLLTPNDFGFFDMYGNAYEWTETVVGNGYRILRGGSFTDPEARLRSAFRNADVPSAQFNTLGFRIARTMR